MEKHDDDDLPIQDHDEGARVRLEHDIYLKAVNNPARRRILELVVKDPLSKEEIGTRLVVEGIIRDPKDVNYHVDILTKAKCVIVDKNLIKVTQGGKVIDYFK
nr:hypothetical protein [Candidatus Sigynarchaeota archaeon]